MHFKIIIFTITILKLCVYNLYTNSYKIIFGFDSHKMNKNKVSNDI